MRHEEDDLQKATAGLIDAIALPGVVAWHTPNGGKRSKREAGRFKAMGVRPGVPDWTIASDALIPTVLFIELKSATGRVSEEQKVFRRDAETAGCLWDLARSIDEFLAVLRRHLVPMRVAKVAA